MNFSYKFPAVRGIQAKREYFIAMIPMKLLSKLFISDDETVFPEYRAQRKINESRIPEIKSYILDNRNTYVFSALSASIDGEYEFISSGDSQSGILEVDMDSVFLINDGQHRKAAIEAAILEDPSLGEETISIVLFKDNGLQRSQQMFTDLNKHAVKTSNSLSTLYDYRDSIAVATKEVIEAVPFFRKYTDKERDILGKNSSKLFTLNSVYKANQRIIRGEDCNQEDVKFLIHYWNVVAENICEWNDVYNNTLTKKDLRENYIVTLAITLNALGKLGRYFYDNPSENMEKMLPALRNVDWLRNNSVWIGRIIRPDGRVLNGDEAIGLTCSVLKKELGIKLTKEEIAKEKQYERKK